MWLIADQQFNTNIFYAFYDSIAFAVDGNSVGCMYTGLDHISLLV